MKKSKSSLRMLCLFTLFLQPLGALAGDLEPPGPPGSAVSEMKTLNQVEPRTLISSLPYVIPESGSYYLIQDLESLENGIVIEADDVTLDLMGFHIRGDGSAGYDGIYLKNRSNIEIRNGSVSNFGNHGISVESDESYDTGKLTFSGNHLRILNMRIINNGSCGIRFFGRNNLVENCTVADNGSTGIYGGNRSNAIIRGNSISLNGGTGITLRYSCSIITNNSVCANEGSGISSETAIVTNNNVQYNSGSGIRDQSGRVSNNNVNYNDSTGIFSNGSSHIIDNIIIGNNNNDSTTSSGCGIRTLSNCVIRGNRLRYNKQVNIYVDGHNNIIENNILSNSTKGIYFLTGTVKNYYTGNKAYKNDVGGSNQNYVGGIGFQVNGGNNVEF